MWFGELDKERNLAKMGGGFGHRPGLAMAANVAMRPLTVPRRPMRVAMLARDQREPTRFSACGLSSDSFSLRAASISSGPLFDCVRPAFTICRMG